MSADLAAVVERGHSLLANQNRLDQIELLGLLRPIRKAASQRLGKECPGHARGGCQALLDARLLQAIMASRAAAANTRCCWLVAQQIAGGAVTR